MDEDEDTQWTVAARERFVAQADAFVAAIQKHVTQTLTRSGRQKELGPYFESTDQLQAMAMAYSDAEFDWCGSSPLALVRDEEDDDDWDDDDEDAPDDHGEVMSVLGRWDYRITDEQALITAGRSAYANTWPDDTAEDAEIAVPDAARAVGELIHASDVAQLEGVDGLELREWTVQNLVHDEPEIDEDDPFGIVRPE